MHEVVTIQLGQQANYIGSHYWNVQVGMYDAVQNDILAHQPPPFILM